MGPIPAAVTIVVRRPNATAPEILLVHRNPALPVQGGVWAFPGGRLDPADGGVDLCSARKCAARELWEETGLRVNASALQAAARWLTPEQIQPRFDTWIFGCEIVDPDVRVDGREIVGYAWLTADAGLQAHQYGDLRLAPPAFVMLSLLAGVNAQRRSWPSDRVLQFKPRLVESAEGRCSLYENDAGYADGDLNRPGERHRLWMGPGAWRYERRAGLPQEDDPGNVK